MKSCFFNETLRRFNMKHIHLLLTFNKETRNYIYFLKTMKASLEKLKNETYLFKRHLNVKNNI